MQPRYVDIQANPAEQTSLEEMMERLDRIEKFVGGYIVTHGLPRFNQEGGSEVTQQLCEYFYTRHLPTENLTNRSQKKIRMDAVAQHLGKLGYSVCRDQEFPGGKALKE